MTNSVDNFVSLAFLRIYGISVDNFEIFSYNGEETKNDEPTIFYIPYIVLESSVAQPNFDGRLLAFKIKGFKPIVEENLENSNRVQYLVSVFLRVISSKEILNEMIKSFDKNGDNQFSKKEINDMYKKCKYPNPTLATNSLFELFDHDKDGKLSVNEVKAALLVDYIIKAEDCLKKFVDTIFNADSNKDNKITWDEARQFFVTCGSNEAQAKVLANSMFEDVDSDDDKCITREELRKYAIEYFEIYPTE
ncbi:hypothetical protein ACTFIT_005833 [Dictyostelium discoideum]